MGAAHALQVWEADYSSSLEQQAVLVLVHQNEELGCKAPYPNSNAHVPS